MCGNENKGLSGKLERKMKDKKGLENRRAPLKGRER